LHWMMVLLFRRAKVRPSGGLLLSGGKCEQALRGRVLPGRVEALWIAAQKAIVEIWRLDFDDARSGFARRLAALRRLPITVRKRRRRSERMSNKD